MSEPGTITAGDSVSWTRTLIDHPAPEWSLHYALFNAAANYSFDAVGGGADHTVTLAAATTKPWEAGRYDWTAYVDNAAGDRSVVATGAVIVKPDPATGLPYDARSHARKMLEAIEATIEKRATAQQLDLVRSAVGDRSGDLAPEKLIEWRDKYRREVQIEEQKAALERGEKLPRSIKVRFGRG